MAILRGLLRVVLIWILSGVAAPYVSRAFARLARRAPAGSFVQAALLELSTGYSAMLVAIAAEVLAAWTIESMDFLFRLAAALRLRPAPGSTLMRR